MKSQASEGKLLLVDDDSDLAAGIEAVLASRGYAVTIAEDGDIALDLAETGSFDLVLADLQMPVMGGIALLEALHKVKPRLPVIIMTAFNSTEAAIEATKLGAFDYLIKPVDMQDLLDLTAKGVTSHRLTAKPVKLGSVAPGVDAIIGTSAPMQGVYKEVGRVASKPIPVLIQGETGTGKELIARAIYQHSDRADKAFVAVNCAAIPDTLIESELFGHEKGSFTNAIATRIGRFEQAHGGTLFLDEIGDLPWNTQVKLLRVLEQKTISRVGGKEEIPLDVRIICATHRDLPAMIAEGTFREDLFYRVNTVTIQLPPLRKRPDDIVDLVHYFLNKYAAEFELEIPAIQRQAMTAMERHPWPGNVRQLENVIKKVVVEARGRAVGEEHMREMLRGEVLTKVATASNAGNAGWKEHISERLHAANAGDLERALEVLTEDLERELYAQAVAMTLGNQSHIAKLLGVSRLTVREKLDRYALYPKRPS